jgi:hypothetical protein
MNMKNSYVKEKQFSAEEVSTFKQKHLTLNEDIQAALKNGNQSPIGDGAFDFQGYLNAQYKILWLMKEPYDTNKGEIVGDRATGGWYFSGSTIYLKREFGAARTTWYPIINTSHAILTNQSVWDQEQRITKGNKKTSDVLSHIAYVNVQKLASVSREKTNNQLIREAFLRNLHYLEKQFQLLDPDIIIGANTLNNQVFEHFGLQGKKFTSTPSHQSYESNGKLFIDAKHPAQRSIAKQTYINDILSTVQLWKQTR